MRHLVNQPRLFYDLTDNCCGSSNAHSYSRHTCSHKTNGVKKRREKSVQHVVGTQSMHATKTNQAGRMRQASLISSPAGTHSRSDLSYTHMHASTQ